MKKRLLSFVLGLVLVCASIVPVTVSAEPLGGYCGKDVTWSYDNGSLTISGSGKMDDFPSIEGRPWYSEMNRIKLVSFENGITHIGDFSLSCVTAFNDLILPDSVVSIGNNAFESCTSMNNVRLPDGLTSIGERAFRGSSSLWEIIIPESVQTIGREAFYHCVFLSHVTLPSKLEKIEDLLLADCTNLKSVTIPESVSSIGIGAFFGCGSITDIYYTGTKEQWEQITVAPDGDYYNNSSLKNATVHFEFDGATSDYSDVDPYKWYTPAVDYVSKRGFMKGIGQDLFDPLGEMTRGMLVTVLYRLEGSPETSSEVPFVDLTADWYKDAVAWAYENEIIYGTSDTTFSPDDTLTREQLATIFYRYAGYKGFNRYITNIEHFPDYAEISSWAQTEFKWAYATFIIKGVPRDEVNILDPRGKATRAQVATILMRYCTVYRITD